MQNSHQKAKVRDRSDFAKLYAKIPLSVLMDKRLKPSDVAVYGGISWNVWQGNMSSGSFADFAGPAGVSRRQVADSMKRLIQFGHIEPAPSNRPRTIGTYCLTSQVFAQRQGKENIVVSAPSGGKRLASVRKEVA